MCTNETSVSQSLITDLDVIHDHQGIVQGAVGFISPLSMSHADNLTSSLSAGFVSSFGIA